MKTLIIRYLGQNSTPEESDINREELRDFADHSWLEITRIIQELHEEGLIFKPAKTLKLTKKGWNTFHNEKLENEITKVKVVREKKEPTKKSEVNMSRLNFKIDNDTRPVSEWKVGELNSSNSIEIVGNVGMSPAQDKCYSRWAEKITNWDTFPRK